MRRARKLLVALAFLGPLACTAGAEDHPVGGDRLILRDSAAPSERRFKFRAVRDGDVDPAVLDDPTAVGATLEVKGAAAGDGDTGLLALDAARWTGLGNPPGARGYRYLDRDRTTGVKKVILKSGNLGGTLAMSGGGMDWPYAVTQLQGGPIDVRLTMGSDVLCARFTAFAINGGRKVKGSPSAAPASCAPPPSPTCGDGSVGGLEECDDGGTTSGDGCSATCQLENTSALCAGVPSTDGTALTSVLVASGLDKPLHVTAPPLDPHRVFIVGQEGTIRILQGGAVLPTAFLDISGQVSCCGERGLLSLAFHPDYENNGLFFVDYTNNAGNTVIARYSVSGNPNVANAGSEQILMTIAQPFANHNGGQLAFGPDGFLYVGMGDGGGGGDPGDRAQDPGTLLGKLLRLDVDQAGPPWAAAGNPFNDAGASLPLDEIWSLGWRNPWRLSFDRATGDMYVGDVGQNAFEEISYEPSGSPGGLNYGWDVFEGDGHCFEGDPECATPGDFVMPVLEYGHGQGCSVTGGFVYRGCAMPDVHGTYFYSDYCSAFIRTFAGVVGGDAQNLADRTADLAPGGGVSIANVTSFGEDARGELYITDLDDGEVFKIVPGS